MSTHPSKDSSTHMAPNMPIGPATVLLPSRGGTKEGKQRRLKNLHTNQNQNQSVLILVSYKLSWAKPRLVEA